MISSLKIIIIIKEDKKFKNPKQIFQKKKKTKTIEKRKGVIRTQKKRIKKKEKNGRKDKESRT